MPRLGRWPKIREWKVEERRLESKRKPPEMAMAVTRSTPTGFSMPAVAEKWAAAMPAVVVEPRLGPGPGPGPSGLSCTLVLYHNLVVQARRFHESGFLLDGIIPCGELLDLLLRAVHFFPLQSNSGESFQHQWPESWVFRLPISYP